MKIFALDTETTGVKQPHAWSLGLVELVVEQTAQTYRLKENRKIECHFNPMKPMEQGAVKVHGITDAMVANFEPITQLDLASLMGITGNEQVCILGHNIAYDINTLLNTASASNEKILKNAVKICTLKLARNHLSAKSYRLGDLMRVFLHKSPQELENAHNALTDCIFCIDLANHIISKILKEQPINETKPFIEQLSAFARRLDSDQYAFLQSLDEFKPLEICYENNFPWNMGEKLTKVKVTNGQVCLTSEFITQKNYSRITLEVDDFFNQQLAEQGLPPLGKYCGDKKYFNFVFYPISEQEYLTFYQDELVVMDDNHQLWWVDDRHLHETYTNQIRWEQKKVLSRYRQFVFDYYLGRRDNMESIQ